MSGVFGGIVTGLAVAAAGFVALALALPPVREASTPPSSSETMAVEGGSAQSQADEIETPPAPEPVHAEGSPEGTSETRASVDEVEASADPEAEEMIPAAASTARESDDQTAEATTAQSAEPPETTVESERPSALPRASQQLPDATRSAPDIAEAEPAAESPGEAQALASEAVQLAPAGAPEATMAPAEAAEMAPASPEPSADQPAEPLPAWRQFAAAFDAPEERALYAVILIDASADPQTEADLVSLSAPVTVALNPTDPDAPRRARIYRSAGHEVAILATAPVTTSAIANQRRVFPEAVGWIAPPTTEWPANATSRERLLEILESSGLAIVVREGMTGFPEIETTVRVVNQVDAASAERAAVLSRFDLTAKAASGGASVALLGRAGHASVLDALMQRAGRTAGPSAAPAPLSAVVARGR